MAIPHALTFARNYAFGKYQAITYTLLLHCAAVPLSHQRNYCRVSLLVTFSVCYFDAPHAHPALLPSRGRKQEVAVLMVFCM